MRNSSLWSQPLSSQKQHTDPPGCKTKENHSLRNSTEQSRNEGTKRWSGYGKERRENMGRCGHADEKHKGGFRKGKEHKLKLLKSGPGERMAYQLRAPVALREEPGSIPGTYKVAYNHPQLPLYWSHRWYTYIHLGKKSCIYFSEKSN